MTNRIENLFSACRRDGRKALIGYLTMGCPTCEAGEKLADRMIESGADMLELGVPFSDPTADGPVIQRAGHVALANGATLEKILKTAGKLRRRHPETPMILFSYFNVMLNRGLEKLTAELETIGMDGILAVDLPFEEEGELLPLCRRRNLALIPLLSPATGTERARKLTAGKTGFAYCIMVRGVTGARSVLADDAVEMLTGLRSAVAPLPLAAGFGISSPETAREAAAHADAVVVGSAVVSRMLDAATPEEGIRDCGEFISALKAVL
ncbi:MAG: tryptophan synthase subunit alpha [Victivallaceae bacterium]|nr:tryptophan synthase subunit alpha [Victivallaceae bacterium]